MTRSLIRATLCLNCALGFVLCPRQKVAFYHVPKAAGFTVTNLLSQQYHCEVYWGILTPDEFSPEWRNERDPDHAAVDPAHLTPLQLGEYASLGEVLPGSTASQRTGEHSMFYRNQPLLDRQRTANAVFTWSSFAVVRNPYTRVLAAFEQRSNPFYDQQWPCNSSKCGHRKHPDTFVEFMRWLSDNLARKKLSWCCDPTIVHFRPASMYTHWDHNLREPTRLVNFVIKLETLNEDLHQVLDRLFSGGPVRNASDEHANEGRSHKARSRLCRDKLGCRRSELRLLLKSTLHTPETVKIVNHLYAADFYLHDYKMLQV